MSYFLHYLLRLRPEKQGSALAFGASLDCAFNSLLEDKKNGIEPDLEKAKDAFDQEFKKFDPKGIKFSKADFDDSLFNDRTENFEEKCYASLMNKGEILIQEYASQALPRIEKVLEVQRVVTVTNANGDVFTGIVDLIAQIDGRVWICDNKSTSIKYKDDSADTSPQLMTYYELLRQEYDLAGVAFITVPKTLRKKKRPIVDISFIFGQADEALIEKTFQDYDAVLDGIKNGKFECGRNNAGGCCSTPWGCEFKNYCTSGGKDTTGLRYEKKR